MNRIAQAFQNNPNHKALITYITAGDPNLDATLKLMHSMANSGADIIELGIPFSDPMADGAVIQRAVERALAQGVSLKNVLQTVARFRKTNQTTPIVLMGYLNPVHKMGYEVFAQACADAGVDGVLTVDNPIETAQPLHNALKQHGIDSIFLVAPTTTEARMQAIAKQAGGFVYYVSLKGVTGSAQLDTQAVAQKIAVLKQHIHLPIGVGFGISDAASAQKIAQIADAAIVGSRIVQTIENHVDCEIEAVSELVQTFKTAILAA
ncbi:MAG: tryptophan synthase subunit alpha [Alysiella sp.]|uniref:tryptophan synthase subunit alpha n=1 Tax=Alysiella sp. TaxID=1872483 RepID=UPI0026DB20A9|nr:tryptophan synthase subunit alpha [Alysiella sp.]MDO4434297.1 tryptophan synthase subunit alpha [Alysiella sp.]